MYNKVIIAFLGNAKFDARCINMANSLTNSGLNVILIDELDKFNEGLKSKLFQVIHVDTKQKNGILRYWNYHCRVQEIASKESPDIFIAGDLFSLAVCSNQNNICLKIYDCRELYSKLTSLVYQPAKQFFWSLFERKYYKNIDKILVTAQKDKFFLISRYGQKQIELIFNFPNTQVEKYKLNLRKKFNIQQNHKIFIYQGAVQIGRGIEEMISLLPYFENCVACVVGNGQHKSQIIKLSKQLNILDRVFFTGSIPYRKLIYVTQQADIGFSIIQPLSESYQQALPNKLFEYGLAGIPTIASNFPEMKNYINKFKLGITVSPTDIEEQISGIKELLNWDAKEDLIQTVQDNFTWESQEPKFLNLFNK